MQLSVASNLLQRTMTHVNLDQTLFSLHKNVDIANLVYYGKCRWGDFEWVVVIEVESRSLWAACSLNRKTYNERTRPWRRTWTCC